MVLCLLLCLLPTPPPHITVNGLGVAGGGEKQEEEGHIAGPQPQAGHRQHEGGSTWQGKKVFFLPPSSCSLDSIWKGREGKGHTQTAAAAAAAAKAVGQENENLFRGLPAAYASLPSRSRNLIPDRPLPPVYTLLRCVSAQTEGAEGGR